MSVSTWLPLNNAMAAPFVSYGPNNIFMPWVYTFNVPAAAIPPIITGGSLLPIYPLPGSAGGIGSWAF